MQTIKETVLQFHNNLHDTKPQDVKHLLSQYFRDDVRWHFPHPINDLCGIDTVAEKFFIPLLNAIPRLRKRDYMLFSGDVSGEWVCSSGNYIGAFEHDFLDIPCTARCVWVRYGDFYHFKNGLISEVYSMLDLLDWIRQAGYRLVPAVAPEIIIPGPETCDGILLGAEDPSETERTRSLVTAMFGGLDKVKEAFVVHRNQGLTDMEEDAIFWDPEMMWYGPAGIGTTFGIDGYELHHGRPMLKAVPDRVIGDHFCWCFEGHYSAIGGWPLVYATHTGSNWLGLPPTGRKLTLRVMNFWRRDAEKLAENWIFYDVIDLFQQLDINLFDRLRQLHHRSDAYYFGN